MHSEKIEDQQQCVERHYKALGDENTLQLCGDPTRILSAVSADFRIGTRCLAGTRCRKKKPFSKQADLMVNFIKNPSIIPVLTHTAELYLNGAFVLRHRGSRRPTARRGGVCVD